MGESPFRTGFISWGAKGGHVPPVPPKSTTVNGTLVQQIKSTSLHVNILI